MKSCIQFVQIGGQLFHIAVGKAVALHAHSLCAVNVLLQVVNKHAFLCLQIKLFTQTMIDLRIGLEHSFLGRNQNALELIDIGDLVLEIMEAMTAVSVAALTVYDMCKAVQRDITITDIRLMYKSGGKSGVYQR